MEGGENELTEKPLPWWKRAISFLRSVFQRPAKVETAPVAPVAEAMPTPSSEPVVREPVQQPVEVKINAPAPEQVAVEPVQEPLPEPLIEPEPEPVPERELVEELEGETAPVIEKSIAVVEEDSTEAVQELEAAVPQAEVAEVKEIEEPESVIAEVEELKPEPEPEPAQVEEAAVMPEPQVEAELAEPAVLSKELEPVEEVQIVEVKDEAEQLPEPEPGPEAEEEEVAYQEPEEIKVAVEDPEPQIEEEFGQQEETIEVVVVEKVIERAEVEEIKQELEPTPEPQAAEAPVAPETHSTPAPSVAAESEPEPELAPEPVLAQPQPATPIKHTIKPDDDKNSPFSILVGQVYEGPMDLLLDLIRKQDIDIYDIPIAKITEQFLFYVEHMRASEMDIAGEFIYTASLLIHIKSKMLLPRAPSGPEDLLDDPRRELVERLLEHERFKNAAQMLQQKQMIEAATWSNPGIHEFKGDEGTEPELAADTVDLARVFQEILERFKNRPIINVEEDQVTVGQMIQFLGRRLNMEDRPIALRKLLAHTHSRRSLVAMFLALLELVRLQAILLRQDRLFSEIFIKKHEDFDSVMTEGFMAARDDWG